MSDPIGPSCKAAVEAISMSSGFSAWPMRSVWPLMLAALALPGCATTSFAPPRVDLQSRSAPTFEDAIADVDVFILKYRSFARDVANGRQYFEVPAFLGSVAAVAATAFGASSDATIGAGAASAVLGGGRAYYAPRD